MFTSSIGSQGIPQSFIKGPQIPYKQLDVLVCCRATDRLEQKTSFEMATCMTTRGIFRAMLVGNAAKKYPPSTKMVGPRISRKAPSIRFPQKWRNSHTTHLVVPPALKAFPNLKIRACPPAPSTRFQVRRLKNMGHFLRSSSCLPADQ